MKKCIHTVVIDDFFPEMCSVTIPNLKAYAKRIRADFNLITKPKFPGYPPNFERFQIWEAGRDYDFNLNIDADTVFHPNAEDPTLWFPTDHFGSLWKIQASFYFHTEDDIYFIRDGRDLGVSDCFTISTKMTHDVWELPDQPFDLLSKMCKKEPRQVSEYWLSRNMAKYGIKHGGAFKDHSKHFSLMTTTTKRTDKESAEIFTNKLKEWGTR